MSTTPSAGTFLPASVRAAKIIGTVSAGVLTGYLTATTSFLVPSLRKVDPDAPALSKTISSTTKKLKATASPLAFVTSCAYAYVSWYHFDTETPQKATAEFTDRSFFLKTKVEPDTAVPWVATWMWFALPVMCNVAAIAWARVPAGLGGVEARFDERTKAIEASEAAGMGAEVVDGGSVREDIDVWVKKMKTRLTLVTVGLVGGALGCL